MVTFQLIKYYTFEDSNFDNHSVSGVDSQKQIENKKRIEMNNLLSIAKSYLFTCKFREHKQKMKLILSQNFVKVTEAEFKKESQSFDLFFPSSSAEYSAQVSVQDFQQFLDNINDFWKNNRFKKQRKLDIIHFIVSKLLLLIVIAIDSIIGVVTIIFVTLTVFWFINVVIPKIMESSSEEIEVPYFYIAYYVFSGFFIPIINVLGIGVVCGFELIVDLIEKEMIGSAKKEFTKTFLLPQNQRFQVVGLNIKWDVI